MADELKLRFGADFAKGSAVASMESQTQSVTVAGTRYIHTVQTIDTSAEAMTQGDVGTPGYILAHNLDATNYVEIGYDDTGFKPLIRLNAGERACFRSTQAAPQAQANTAAVELEFIMFEA